ncbi:MAG: aldose 1-epimerase [Fibrobacter sp.]|nr:aldose 1-epimerase [Fibrobacter sp.]
MNSFKIVSRPLGTVECFVIRRNDGAELEILSGFGAGLNAWRVPCKAFASQTGENGLVDLLFGYRDGSTIHQLAPDTNAGCRLTPFPGRTAFAKFNWNGTTYQLENNVSWAPHALHGFLQNKPWKFQSFESDSEKGVAIFSCDWPGAFAGFPFPFRAVNKVTFTGESFTVESSVTNIGAKPMPYSEGWHPYFMLGGKVDDLVMDLPESKLALLDSADLPTGNFKDDTRFVGGRKIGGEFINDCFCLGEEFANAKISDGTCAHVTLKSENQALIIWQQTGVEQYNAIQIYTPPDRKSIAIEPMTAEPDALNHHRGLIVVTPGETKTFTFGASLK